MKEKGFCIRTDIGWTRPQIGARVHNFAGSAVVPNTVFTDERGIVRTDRVRLEVSEVIVERKLIALRKRLVDAQRGLLLMAAETETLPTSNALRQIADLENAIVATETMIEEQKAPAQVGV